MKKLLTLLACLLLCTSGQSAVNTNGTNCYPGTTSANVDGSGPLTIAAWVKTTTLSSDQHAVASPGSFSIATVDAGDCSGSQVVAFVKFGVVGVCSSHTPPLNTWEFEAAVVNSGNTQVHFLFMTPAGV